jgi:hypothetical protein
VADQVVLLDKKTKPLEDEANDISGEPVPF